MKIFKKINTSKLILASFALLILAGTILLMLPVSRNRGMQLSFIDSLFTATSAVCVTGLVVTDTAQTFSVFGRIVIAALIQVGALGITSIGVGVMLITRRNVGIKERNLIKEGLNVDAMGGMVRLIRSVLVTTVSIETLGAILSFFVFNKRFPFWDAVGISLFHSIAAFNNSGFDILGGFKSLSEFADSGLLITVTSFLVIFGGLGFLVIKECVIIIKEAVTGKRLHRISLHSKIVLLMTVLLLAGGTVLLKISDPHLPFGTAWFYSMSARTAGFATVPIERISTAGTFLMIILMFIGASPGSTGGGIKTTTFFVIMKSMFSNATKRPNFAFKRKIPENVVYKAFTVLSMSLSVVCTATFLLCVFEPYGLKEILFEVVSAFGTVGLSANITPLLSPVSKFVLILTMYIGKLGAISVAAIWMTKKAPNFSYSEESISVG